MTPLLTVIEDAIIAKLAPMVGEGSGRIRQVDQLSFNTAEELAELLEKHRPRMPGAVLSSPNIVYPKGAVRVVDAVLTYSLIIGYADRSTPAERRAFHHARHDEVMQYLANQAIGKTGIATTAAPDFIRMQTWRMADDAEFAVQMFTFEITVRNWQINSPA